MVVEWGGMGWGEIECNGMELNDIRSDVVMGWDGMEWNAVLNETLKLTISIEIAREKGERMTKIRYGIEGRMGMRGERTM